MVYSLTYSEDMSLFSPESWNILDFFDNLEDTRRLVFSKCADIFFLKFLENTMNIFQSKERNMTPGGNIDHFTNIPLTTFAGRLE